MKRFLFFIPIFGVFVFVWLLVPACRNKNSVGDSASPFENVPVEYGMPVPIIEASGIADSKVNPGYCWVEEDSGNPPQVYLLGHTGKILKTIYLKGATNRDWEDIAVAAGPDAGKNYLYIAEIGDNDAAHPSSYFYRLEEPNASSDTIASYTKIEFAYPDGPRDAEAFLVDDASKDIYVVSKRDTKSRVYKIAWPYSITAVNAAVQVSELPYGGVVSAAISPDGKGIILKTYPQLFYYPRTSGESIAQALRKTPINLGYHVEPQGEAVGFATDNSGFYTISEKGTGSAQSLYFYKRK